MDENRHKILIVDDERLNIRMLDAILRDRYEISVAVNGEQALKLAAVSPQPDMVLLDIQMPDMDGYEVCRRLRENEITRKIPVIFITAMTDEEDEKKGLELGAVDYITKPFRPSIVHARLKNHLEAKRQRDLLNRLSSLDGLTGIANRRQLEKFLDQEWRRAVRLGGEIAFILMDIDHFKKYNDNYGHVAGDETLKTIASTLAETVSRSTDLVARYGGEEFACILSGTGLQDAQQVAERLRLAVLNRAIPHAFSDTHNTVTLSLGVAAMAPDRGTTTPSDLVLAADRMLYRAKETGRNCVVAENEAAPALKAASRQDALQASTTSERRPTVLIVDDEPLNITVLDAILREECETVAALSGEQALKRATASTPPDAILLDIQMPGMDGYEVCRRLKAEPRTRKIPVLFITVRSNAEDEKKGLAAGAVDYITKPFRPAIARARVLAHLRFAQALASLEARNIALEELLNLRDSVEHITRHDLKRPLRRILDHAAWLSSADAVQEDSMTGLQQIESEAFNMLETINRSLDLWQLERQTYQLVAVPVDLLLVIKRLATSMEAAGNALFLTLLLNDSPVVPGDSFVVQGEEMLCHAMLANLLKNAGEATPAGENVTGALHDENSRKQICITNRGAIPAEIRSRFFEKGVTAGKKGGNGIGAYSARLIAEKIGAVIDFEVIDEANTSIAIVFPAATSTI